MKTLPRLIEAPDIATFQLMAHTLAGKVDGAAIALAKRLHKTLLDEYATSIVTNGLRKLRSSPGPGFCEIFGQATQIDPQLIEDAISIDMAAAGTVRRMPNTADWKKLQQNRGSCLLPGEARLLTHEDLCRLACAWLSRSTQSHGAHCGTVLLGTSDTCIAPREVIGFQTKKAHGVFDGSYLVKAITSQEEFEDILITIHHDEANEGGIGDFRFFIAQAGILSSRQLPKRWSLIEVDNTGRIVSTTGMALALKRRTTYQVRKELALSMRAPKVDRLSEVMILSKAIYRSTLGLHPVPEFPVKDSPPNSPWQNTLVLA